MWEPCLPGDDAEHHFVFTIEPTDRSPLKKVIYRILIRSDGDTGLATLFRFGRSDTASLASAEVIMLFHREILVCDPTVALQDGRNNTDVGSRG